MDVSLEDSLREVLDDIIDELSVGVCFEVHRSIKLNYFHLEDLFEPISESAVDPSQHLQSFAFDRSTTLSPPAKVPKLPLCSLPYCDVFGLPLNQKKQIDCSCPHCNRLVAATRLAPHLEKCMGMGRSSSRVASRRLTQMNNSASTAGCSALPTSESSSSFMDAFGLNDLSRNSNSPSSGSEKASNSTTRNFKNKSKKLAPNVDSLDGQLGKRKKMNFNQQKLYKEAVRVVNAVDAFPEYLALNLEQRRQVLASICGVVDQSPTHLYNPSTAKMCRRSLKCKVHSSYQRLELRNSGILEMDDFHASQTPKTQLPVSGATLNRNGDSMTEVFGDFDIEPRDDCVVEDESHLLDGSENMGNNNIFDNINSWETGVSSADVTHGIPTYPSMFQHEPSFGTSVSFLSSKKQFVGTAIPADKAHRSLVKPSKTLDDGFGGSTGKSKTSKKQKKK